jgi:hypothetical protein
MRPNLFTYATTELSQDAFLSWLLRARPEYRELTDKRFSLVRE